LLALGGVSLLATAGGVLWYLQNVKPRGQAIPAPREIAKLAPPPAAPATVPRAIPAAPTTQSPPQPQPVKDVEMVWLPGGSFAMGSDDDPSEKPVHRVSVKPFAISKFPITTREWNACAEAKVCPFVSNSRDDAPITNVSWHDAKQFVAWLSEKTQKEYRLPSEAEWEYAARGGTRTKYWWGDQFQKGMANCRNCLDAPVGEQPAKVGSFAANPFGLYDMGGSVDQWVEDCWSKNYQGAPADGSPRSDGDCLSRVIRSGSWRNDAASARATNRDRYDAVVRYPTHGFRIALSGQQKP
jgi:formylglycine-generating enzyme required for sulfatase activity